MRALEDQRGAEIDVVWLDARVIASGIELGQEPSGTGSLPDRFNAPRGLADRRSLSGASLGQSLWIAPRR